MKLQFSAAIVSAATLGAAGIILAATTPGLAGTPDDKTLPGNNILTPVMVPTPVPGIAPASDDASAGAADKVLGKFAKPHEIVQPLPDGDAAADDQDDDYATLAEAVADQSMPDEMDRELQCLATGVYFESKGEPLSGQLAVAKVILNRTKSRRFPTSVCAVLVQPRQFSFVRRGRLPAVNSSSRAWRTAVAVAQVAMKDEWKSPVPGALFFHARYVSPGWRLAKVGTVGNHIFYR